MKLRLLAAVGFVSLALVPALTFAAERRGQGIIDCDISPDSALTFVDGKYAGKADDLDGRPDYLYVSPGIHTLEFQEKGYQTLRIRLRIQAGQELRFSNDLEELESGMRPVLELDMVREEKPPEVRAEDKRGSRGSRDSDDDEDDDEDEEDEEDDSDDDDTADRGRGDRDTREHITIIESIIHVTPVPKTPNKIAYLIFVVEPADAAVWIDQNFIGTARDYAGAPNQMIVTPGAHLVELTRPGYVPAAFKLELKDGEEKLIEVKLKEE